MAQAFPPPLEIRSSQTSLQGESLFKMQSATKPASGPRGEITDSDACSGKYQLPRGGMDSQGQTHTRLNPKALSLGALESC